MGEVIRFPKLAIKREQPEVVNEDLEAIKRKQLYNFAENIVRDFATGVLEDLQVVGIDIENPEFVRDYLYSVEILRAGIYRNYGLSHYLQSYLDNNVKVNEISHKLEIKSLTKQLPAEVVTEEK